MENVAVRPAAQGRGVGRALLAHADRTASRLGLTELRLYTHSGMTENIALYTRLGWHETERRTEHGFQRVFFAKAAHSAGEPGRHQNRGLEATILMTSRGLGRAQLLSL